MTQLALMSKDFFFFTLHAKRLLFTSALKVLSKFYKLILARGFKKRPQRPTTSFPLFFSFSLVDLGKWYARGTCLSFRRKITLQIPLPSSDSFTVEFEGRAEYKCKKKGGTGRRARRYIGGGREGSVWRKKPKMSRVITAKSLNKHV